MATQQDDDPKIWEALESEMPASEMRSRNEHRLRLAKLGLSDFCDVYMYKHRLFNANSVTKLDDAKQARAALCGNTRADTDGIMRRAEWPPKLLLCVHYLAPLFSNDNVQVFPTEPLIDPTMPRSWIDIQPFMPLDLTVHTSKFEGGQAPTKINLITADDFLQMQADLLSDYFGNRLQRNGPAWLEFKAPKFGLAYAPIYAQFKRVPASANVHIIGDLHSSLSSLISIVTQLHSLGALQNLDSFQLRPNHYVVFLGDVVDRGDFSLELLYIVGQLLLANPDSVFLLQGNHEECSTFAKYTLIHEVMIKYDQTKTNALNFLYFLNYLPAVLFLTFEDRINDGASPESVRTVQFCHGALTAIAREQDKLRQLLRAQSAQLGTSTPQFAYLRHWLEGDKDACHPDQAGIPSDNLKWGDFTTTPQHRIVLAADFVANMKKKSMESFLEDGDFSQNDGRGGGELKVFGSFYVQKYLRNIGAVAIISGHQDFTNFAFIAPAGIKPDSERFEVDAHYNGRADSTKLYRPIGYKRFAKELLKQKDPRTAHRHDVYLVPGTDFVAANTSSAYASRYNKESLRLDCFSTLVQYR